MSTYYKHGSWNAICDICGFKFKAEDLRERWDGLRVCKQDFEFRHPQEKRRPTIDVQSVPWTRPETPDVFLPTDAYKYIEDGYVDFGYVHP
jgi:hypothetical protein